jgi:DNA-binding transcriptional regulator LsrR (DeoR family)
MPKIEIEQKRPLDATPERALSMFRAGVKQVEIARLWGIHPSRVSRLIDKATRAENAK